MKRHVLVAEQRRAHSSDEYIQSHPDRDQKHGLARDSVSETEKEA